MPFLFFYSECYAVLSKIGLSVVQISYSIITIIRKVYETEGKKINLNTWK